MDKLMQSKTRTLSNLIVQDIQYARQTCRHLHPSPLTIILPPFPSFLLCLYIMFQLSTLPLVMDSSKSRGGRRPAHSVGTLLNQTTRRLPGLHFCKCKINVFSNITINEKVERGKFRNSWTYMTMTSGRTPFFFPLANHDINTCLIFGRHYLHITPHFNIFKSQRTF